MLSRNVVGRRVHPDLVRRFGGDPRHDYRLAFRVVPMGDHNAVDISQECHLQILKDHGCCAEETL